MKEQKKPLVITGAVIALVMIFFVLSGIRSRQKETALPETRPQEFLSPRTGMMEPVAPRSSLGEPVPSDALAFAATARRLQMYQDARLLGKPDKVTQRQSEQGIETTLYFGKQGGTVAIRYSAQGINQGVDVL